MQHNVWVLKMAWRCPLGRKICTIVGHGMAWVEQRGPWEGALVARRWQSRNIQTTSNHLVLQEWPGLFQLSCLWSRDEGKLGTKKINSEVGRREGEKSKGRECHKILRPHRPKETVWDHTDQNIFILAWGKKNLFLNVESQQKGEKAATQAPEHILSPRCSNGGAHRVSPRIQHCSQAAL